MPGVVIGSKETGSLRSARARRSVRRSRRWPGTGGNEKIGVSQEFDLLERRGEFSAHRASPRWPRSRAASCRQIRIDRSRSAPMPFGCQHLHAGPAVSATTRLPRNARQGFSMLFPRVPVQARTLRAEFRHRSTIPISLWAATPASFGKRRSTFIPRPVWMSAPYSLTALVERAAGRRERLKKYTTIRFSQRV